MSAVALRDVSKSFGATPVIRGLSLDIQAEEFMVLVGPSGCGKSTLLRMIAGLEEIDRGTVTIGGRVVNDVPAKDRNIAMVFQNYALYPHMSVRENLAFGLKMRKTPKVEVRRRVEDAAVVLGIAELLERKPRQLSGGQRQRVAVGRAIVRQPDVFLFDEPLSNLDAKLRAEMRTEIARLQERLRTTTIYVTHDQVEAMTMGDRIAILHEGSLQQAGKPLELYDRPANLFVATFLGSPPMNVVEATVSDDGDAIVLDGAKLPVQEPARAATRARRGRRVFMGIRPERLTDRARADATSSTLATRVELVEPMGSEVIVHVRLTETRLVGKLDAHHLPETGASLALSLDLGHVHLFDAETHERLSG